MSTVHDIALDPVSLEILRSRLQATAEEGGITIERTAISPVITESRDYSSTLLEADGKLIIAGGAISHHFGVCGHAVRATLDRHGDTIAPGDVFFSNDPHNGGGLHAQDVMVQQPVFVDGQLVAWVVNSGHMMDMGGMVFGSWSPAATDCYQEAFRSPSVRLFRQGEEQSDIWVIIRNNVRVPDMVEMDLRGLVAGCHVATEKLVDLATSMGREQFVAGVVALRELAEAEMRRRIASLEDGIYRFVTWTEWGDELFKVPCTLTIDGDRMLFDFEGAPGQTNHFFNSKPHIIAAQVVGDGSDVLAYDLPLSEGMFAPIEVRCPAGSIVNSEPPAPVASAHIDVALNASMAAQQCIMMALAISGDVPGDHLVCGPLAPSTMALHTWAYTTAAGTPDGWMMLDGGLGGGSAAHDRDGYDLFTFMVARKPIVEAIDVEMLERWYPVLTLEKRIRPGAYGAGRNRAGAGCQMAYRPYGTRALDGSLLAIREQLPLPGFAGGFPGGTSEFSVRHADGRVDDVPGKTHSLVITEDEVLEFRLGSGGGYGDPVDRDPQAVFRDVRQNRLTPARAEAVYGLVIVDGEVDETATARRRQQILADRLAAAEPALRPVDGAALPASNGGGGLPLYPGIEQRGSVAYVERSGTPVAVAPDHWTDGCPVLSTPVNERMVQRSYLDPATGHVLLTEAVPIGEARTIEVSPRRWLEAGTAG